VQELRDCVDIASLDQQFYQACCSSHGAYLYASLPGYIGDINATCGGTSSVKVASMDSILNLR
jgi:hypothetical protein